MVESNIHYPTDPSLLRVITRTVKKIKEQGIAAGAEFHNRMHSIKNQVFSINKVLRHRTGETIKEVRKITGVILETVEKVVSQAEQVLTRLRSRPPGKPGKRSRQSNHWNQL